MESNEQKVALLNRAIEINNDRIAGYDKAIELVANENLSDLQSLFEQYKKQSRQFVSEI